MNIINDINKKTTLKQIEKEISEVSPPQYFSETSQGFKFSLLDKAVKSGNINLIRDIVKKEGETILHPFNHQSLFSSVDACIDCFDSYATAYTLMDLGADFEEKNKPFGKSVVELFYDKAKTEVLFLFVNKGVSMSPVSFNTPPSNRTKEALVLVKQMQNCFFLIKGLQDHQSPIQKLKLDVVSIICKLVAELTIFKKIEAANVPFDFRFFTFH